MFMFKMIQHVIINLFTDGVIISKFSKIFISKLWIIQILKTKYFYTLHLPWISVNGIPLDSQAMELQNVCHCSHI